MNLQATALLLAAQLATGALLVATALASCGYRLAGAPALNEPVRVVVVSNDAAALISAWLENQVPSWKKPAP